MIILVSIEQLYSLFLNREIFPRNKIPAFIKAISVKIYIEGLSLRRVSKFLNELGFKVSHESIRKFFKSRRIIFKEIEKEKRIFSFR